MSFQNQQPSSQQSQFNPQISNISLSNTGTNVDQIQLQQEEQARAARQQQILNHILKLTQPNPNPTPITNTNSIFPTSNTPSLFPSNLLSLFSSVPPPEQNAPAPSLEIQIAQLLHQQQQQLGFFPQTSSTQPVQQSIQPSNPLSILSSLTSFQNQIQAPTPLVPPSWNPLGPDASRAFQTPQEPVSTGNLFKDRQAKKKVAWNVDDLDLEEEKEPDVASSESSNDGIDNTSYDYSNYTASTSKFNSKNRPASEGTIDTDAPRLDSKKSKVELTIQATATKTKRGTTFAAAEQPQPTKKQKVTSSQKDQENLPKKDNASIPAPKKPAPKEPEPKPVLESRKPVVVEVEEAKPTDSKPGSGLTLSQIALAKEMAKHQKQLHTHIPDHYKVKKPGALPTQTKTTTTAPVVTQPPPNTATKKPVAPSISTVPKPAQQPVTKTVVPKQTAPAPKPVAKEVEISQMAEKLTPMYNADDDITKINLSMVTVPYQIRKLQLPTIFKLCCASNPTNIQSAFKQARELEFTQVYAKSKNKDHYKALMHNLLTKLKSAPIAPQQPQTTTVPSQEAAKSKLKIASKKSESSDSDSSSSDSSSSDSESNDNNNKKKKKAKVPSGNPSDVSSMRKKVKPLQLKPSAISEKFRASYYLLTKDQMLDNDYPHMDIYNQNTLEMLRDPELNSEEPHKCSRCSQPFQYRYNTVGKDKKELIVEAYCQYHSGKGRIKGDASGNKSRVYSCCGCSMQESKGCTKGPHVFDYGNFANMVKAGVAFVHTRPDPNKKGMFAIDCEMCFTTGGFELIRVTVVNEACEVVYDKLVKPKNCIVDYNSQFSGITAADLDPIKTTLQEVQKDLLDIIGQDTILIGQSLNSDLKALRMIHHSVIDTSIIYPHPRGPPLKRSLKELASKYLQRFIQQKNSEEEGHGHDSFEDAVISMQLVQLKIASGPAFGKYL